MSLILKAIVLAFVVFIPIRAEAAADALHIRPSQITMGMFYGGSPLKLDGVAPSGDELAVVCIGKRVDLELKRKEKVMGLLWMNRDEVMFEGIPSFYAVSASRSLEELAPRQVLDRLGVGLGAFPSRPSKGGAGKNTKGLFAELVKLRKREHLFILDEDGIAFDRQGKGRKHWSAVVPLPAKLAPGEYQIRLFGFHDGSGTLIDSKTLSVRQVGLAVLIRSLAEQHGIIYGIGAVLAALAAGLLTGLIFGLGSKGGH